MKNTSLPCHFCGNKTYSNLKNGKFNLKITYHICDNCKTAFLDKKHIQNNDDYYEEGYEKWFYQNLSKNKTVKYSFTDASARVFLLSFFLKNFKDKNILDVGCGIGGTLKLLDKLGATTKGIEPSKNYSIFNQRVLNLDVKTAFINDYNSKKNKFDLITLFDVIEHVENPLNVMRHLKSLLKTDGTLFFTTPHIKRSNSSVIFQQSHIYLFSLHSINKIVNNANLYIDNIILFGGSLNIFCKIKNDDIKIKNFEAKYLEDYTSDELKNLGRKYIPKMLLKIHHLVRYHLISMFSYYAIRKNISKNL